MQAASSSPNASVARSTYRGVDSSSPDALPRETAARIHQLEAQLDASQREALRASTQLSLRTDEWEASERRAIRLEAQLKTTADEVEALQEDNRKHRREVDELRREQQQLLATRTSLMSANTTMQQQLQDALSESAALRQSVHAAVEQRNALDAVVRNLEQQVAVAAHRQDIVGQQKQSLEIDVVNQRDAITALRRLMDVAKHRIEVECSNYLAILERNLVHAHGGHAAWNTPAAEDDLLALVSLVGNQGHSDGGSSSEAHFTSVALPVLVSNSTSSGGSTAVMNASIGSSVQGQGQGNETSVTVKFDVKSLMTPLYQSGKLLRQFLIGLRDERSVAAEQMDALRRTCSAADRELERSITENKQLSQRVIQAEVQATRVASQLDATSRRLDDVTTQHHALLQHLSDVLHLPQGTTDPVAMETQCRLVSSERDQLKEQCRHLQEQLGSLKQALADATRTAQERVEDSEATSREALLREQKTFEERLAAISREKQRLEKHQQDLSAAHAEEIASLRAELDIVAAQRRETAQKLASAEPQLRQAQLELQVSEERRKAKEREASDLAEQCRLTEQRFAAKLEAVRRKVGPYHAAALHDEDDLSVEQKLSTATHPPPTFCTVFELLIVTLRALAGCRKDLNETCWQRRALTRYLLEYEAIFGPLSAQHVPSTKLRRVLKLRRVVVAVLAALRLKRLAGRGRPNMNREAVTSGRKGFARVRLPIDALVLVEGGAVIAPEHLLKPSSSSGNLRAPKVLREAEFVLPSTVEAHDVPGLVATLLEQVRASPVPPSDAWNHVAPSLLTHLQTSLHRWYVHCGRLSQPNLSHSHSRGNTSIASSHPQMHASSPHLPHPSTISSPARGPSIVYPAAASTASALQQSTMSMGLTDYQQQVQEQLLQSAVRQRPLSAANYVRGMGGSPPPPPFSVESLPVHPAHHYTPVATARTPVGLQHAVSSHSPGQVGARGGSDEFCAEVLNVIRALDNRVSGALRLPHAASNSVMSHQEGRNVDAVNASTTSLLTASSTKHHSSSHYAYPATPSAKKSRR